MAVCLDLDGCIIDSRAAILPSVRLALAPHGLGDLPDEELRGLIGPPLDVGFADLLTRHGRDPGLTATVIAAYRQDYRAHMLERTTLVPGMAEAVARIGEARLACVVTSKPAPFARPILDHLGVTPSLAFIEGPSLDDPAEAKKVTLGRALDRLGPVRDAVMVGDRHHDIDAGKAHGLRTVGVLWGIGDAEELRAAGADDVVATPHELVELLT
ncbi:MAG: Haloacid dehalogenase domain protein hydrolase [Actinomycetia bacterium]|nr:Haloacid dehalogenase domain protein hydrolase [Actinomycetes bacterium]